MQRDREQEDGGNKLARYLIPKGADKIYYIPDFITKGEEEYLKDCVYKAPKPRWTQLQNRRLQNWGGIPHAKGMIAEVLPSVSKNYILKYIDWLQSTVERISELRVFGDKKPNHVLVNEYLSGQGIMPHLDGPLFYPTITTLNLGSHGILNFYRPMEQTNEDNNVVEDWERRLEFSLLLEPKSLLILQETCYNHFLHGIEERCSDIVTSKILNVDQCKGVNLNDVIPRETRISLTIRHVPKTTKPILRLGRR